MLSPDALAVLDIAREAGAVILARYGRASLYVTDKSDGSPVTDADVSADALIRERLAARWPDPIVSEETPPPPEVERQSWSRWWLVDPLDGTRDFVARTGEFCVCIARIEAGLPTLGVIMAPVSGLAWAAERGRGTWRFDPNRDAPIRVRTPHREGPLTAFTSRFHHVPEAEGLVRALGATATAVMGSALKFARLAEGDADVFASFGGAKLWDLAAGQLIAEEAGCRVLSLADPGSPRIPRHDGPSLIAGPYVALGPRLDDGALDRVEYRAP